MVTTLYELSRRECEDLLRAGTTARVAFVGAIHRFRAGRHFAAYLGLPPREASSGLVQILAERFAFNPRGRDMRSDTIYGKHQKRKKNAFPELGDVEYILYTGKHLLNHLGLSAGGLNFLHGALAEFMRAHGQFGLQLTHTEYLESIFHIID